MKTNPKCQNVKYFATTPNNNSELEYDDRFGVGVRVRSTLSTLSLDQSPVCFHSIIYRNSYRLGSDSCHVLTSAFNSLFGKMIKSPLSILASTTVLIIEPLLIENISCSTSLPKIVVIVSCPMLPEEDMGGCGQFFVEAGACNTTRVGFPSDKVYIFGFFGLDKTLLRIFLEFRWGCLSGLQSLLAPSRNE